MHAYQRAKPVTTLLRRCCPATNACPEARCLGRLILLLFALVAMLAAEPAGARIGETEAECVERYGEVVERRLGGLADSDELRSVFRAGAFQIVVEFHQGRAWRIDYRKALIDEVDVERVLDWNKIDQPWGKPFRVYGDRFWLRADREVLVRTLRGDGGESVVVMNRAHLEASAADRRRQIQELIGPDLSTVDPSESLLP